MEVTQKNGFPPQFHFVRDLISNEHSTSKWHNKSSGVWKKETIKSSPQNNLLAPPIWGYFSRICETAIHFVCQEKFFSYFLLLYFWWKSNLIHNGIVSDGFYRNLLRSSITTYSYISFLTNAYESGLPLISLLLAITRPVKAQCTLIPWTIQNPTILMGFVDHYFGGFFSSSQNRFQFAKMLLILSCHAWNAWKSRYRMQKSERQFSDNIQKDEEDQG